MRPWQPRKRDCRRAEPETWSRATEVRTAEGGSGGRVALSGKPSLRGPRGQGPRRSPVTAARSCGEAGWARARRSLGCGAVAPAALRADWMAAPEEAGGVRRPDAGMGFRGRPGPSGRFLTLSLGGSSRLAHRARAHRPADFPFGRRHKMAAPGGGATVRARGPQSSLPGGPAGPGGRGAPWGPPRGARGQALSRGGVGSESSPPAPRSSAAGPGRL